MSPFAQTLRDLGCPAPWSATLPTAEVGDIHDANGAYVLTVDINAERPEIDVLRIAKAVADAVNAAAESGQVLGVAE